MTQLPADPSVVSPAALRCPKCGEYPPGTPNVYDPCMCAPPALDVERTVALLNDWAEEWTERADMSRIGAGYRYSEDSEVKQAHARQMAVEADANVGLLRALASSLPGWIDDAAQWRRYRAAMARMDAIDAAARSASRPGGDPT